MWLTIISFAMGSVMLSQRKAWRTGLAFCFLAVVMLLLHTWIAQKNIDRMMRIEELRMMYGTRENLRESVPDKIFIN